VILKLVLFVIAVVICGPAAMMEGPIFFLYKIKEKFIKSKYQKKVFCIEKIPMINVKVL